ncbi:unnamed protein product [Clonostachys rosea]|uniref:Peptidase S8/S53 domain-containing protein n=1 Tax=Bionectria ochroleuca TaxID=29856 RepID=A0ABY6UGQ5_BIOOC|nr:unnamed protein product [Clonostachys rosea]
MHAYALLALIPLAMAAPPPSFHKREQIAPLVVPLGGNHIQDKYIVRMKKDSVSSSVTSAISAIKAESDFVYTHSFNGFAATLDDEDLATIRKNPMVDYVEKDQTIYVSTTQQNAPWGISRLSSKTPGSTTYNYDPSAGEGTCAYVLDTGIAVAHPEFEGRATWAANFAGDGQKVDGVGHGTHCAGTIGSKTYGVAKKTQLFAVKVLGSDGSGTNSGVIAGMEWVVKNADKSKCPKGIVASMSLGGGFSQAMNDAAAAIVDAGIFLAVAAGNDAANAAQTSPASEPKVCTVGASDVNDRIAEFSNFGKVVDIFAPGVGILSTIPGGRTEKMSGTSMATPHIAGLAAYLLGTGQKVAGLCDYIKQTGVQTLTGGPNGTTRTIANNGYSGNSQRSYFKLM